MSDLQEQLKERARPLNTKLLEELVQISNVVARQNEDLIAQGDALLDIKEKQLKYAERHDIREGGKVAKFFKGSAITLAALTTVIAAAGVLVALLTFKPEDWPVIQDRLILLVETIV